LEFPIRAGFDIGTRVGNGSTDPPSTPYPRIHTHPFRVRPRRRRVTDAGGSVRAGAEWAGVWRAAVSAVGGTHADLRDPLRGELRAWVVLHARGIRGAVPDRGDRKFLAGAAGRTARGGLDRGGDRAVVPAAALSAATARPGAAHVRVHLLVRGRREVDLGRPH